ncbi:MAG: hypothetical protein K0Q66_2011 [Chitinophagaceae bacterium]|nr:hypothetical protein [Chitinophagaceae bacterium]
MEEAFEITWEGPVQLRPGTPSLISKLAGNYQDEIEQYWLNLTRRSPKAFNGDILVNQSQEVKDGCLVVYAEFIEYKIAVASNYIPALKSLVKTIGVSGVITNLIGESQAIVLGKRGATVTQYPGYWELVPSGSIDKTFIQPDSSISIERCILQELQEEIGIRPEEVQEVKVSGLVYDKIEGIYDICCTIQIKPGIDIPDRLSGNAEYASFLCLPVNELKSWLETERGNMVPTSIAILSMMAETKEMQKEEHV